MDADVVVVGAGLSGLVAAGELAAAGRSVVLLDQESGEHLGGQAWWSLGGLFLVDTPEQRRMGVRDSAELAWADWAGTAGFDRLEGAVPQDLWGSQWARAYVDWAAGEKRSWLRSKGVSFFPVVGWAERGDGTATGHGNSVPRFHVTWGTGPGVVAPFERAVRSAAAAGRISVRGRHRVTDLVTTDGAVTGVRGEVLATDGVARGARSTRSVVGAFEIDAQAVVVTSGGIGANNALIRQFWPERLGTPPADLLTGVPAYVDGAMLSVTQEAGARLVNRDRMWHYTEGLSNHDPVWPGHGVRILPGPSGLWLDATGQRLPAPFFPGFDTLGTLAHLRATGHDHSWFVLTSTILGKEWALSGSEQNPDLTGRSLSGVLSRARSDVPEPVRAFVEAGIDVVTGTSVPELAAQMNALSGEDLVDAAALEHEVRARDLQVGNDYGKDAQLNAVQAARRYRGDRLVRTAAPHRFLDPAHGPLVAARLRVLTRKTLGGIQTDLGSRALDSTGRPVPGLYAAGEVAGFGGGGMHGYRSLEGTFLGGCLFSGRSAGRTAAADLA
ncbi:FAD-binding dehydrogenase [Ornithinimicrobium sediminis]|uniref:FAD-binding dehydrogenase n=1 Tax=Ornithinimicrobium sediminis TaxID=2904603 RepID=UPI001E483FF4|nr:FAD-binding dehydrogenase [Ornithinimicrobium sediminis]